jgi:hypothetical protein
MTAKQARDLASGGLMELTLTREQADLIRDAACDFTDHRDGAFFRAGHLLDDDTKLRIRGLVFAGLLKLDNQLVQTTSAGRDAIRAAAR